MNFFYKNKYIKYKYKFINANNLIGGTIDQSYIKIELPKEYKKYTYTENPEII